VLVHGSGPHDRDETIAQNKPFRDLAWGLASNGIAVFRYDKRTLVHGMEMSPISDHIGVKEETVDDAVAALELLAETEGIDRERVFVLGHSLGGMLAPMISESTDAERGLIMLAAPTRPLEDLILEQVTYLAGIDGNTSDEEQAELDKVEEQVARVKSLNSESQVQAEQLPLGLPAFYWLSIQGYSPAEVAVGLAEPMLILQGERDFQVTMDDFAGWEMALGGEADVVLKSYPGLNHLFMDGTGPSTPTEYELPGNVAEEAVQDIADWIADR
jgi:alpha-beta hydrolase superfamily lysophospholipase